MPEKPVERNEKNGSKISDTFHFKKNCLLSILATPLFGENYRLHARDVETLPAAQILASHHVVFAQHVGAGFGEAGAIALVGATAELTLLSADYPVNFVLAGLLAVGTVERRRFFLLALVEKFAFFHSSRWSLVFGR